MLYHAMNRSGSDAIRPNLVDSGHESVSIGVEYARHLPCSVDLSLGTLDD